MGVLVEIFLPKETVSDAFATIAKLYVNNRDKVNKGDQLVDLETSKTIVSVVAEQDGFVELFCKQGEDVEVGAHLMNIVETAEEVKEFASDSTSEFNTELHFDTVFSKSALELINKHRLDKSKFASKDFVSQEDVLHFIHPPKKAVKQNNFYNNKQSHWSDLTIDSNLIDLEPLSNSKRNEIQYLSDVQSGVMNSVLNVAVDAGNIQDAIEDSFKVFKGSYLPLIVFELSRLLLKYKVFNAYFMGDNIAFYKSINVGIATDIDDGLKVLTLANTDQLNMSAIEDHLYHLVEKYLDKKLEVVDVTGSTFTITDLSSAGIDFFTPLINTKQSAILGVSQMDKKLNRFYLTLVFDHRVTEGKLAAEFLVELKNRIESYSFLENKAEEKREEKTEESFLEVRCGSCLKTLEEDKRLKGVGMIKIINHEGKEDTICASCLAGF